MKLDEGIKHLGMWKIKIKNLETGIVKEDIVKNTIMDVGIDKLLSNLYSNANNNCRINYIAIGEGDTAISKSQTQLVTEIFRTIPSINSYKFATGQVMTEFILGSADANTDIEEIGIFVGVTATSTVNTGILLSRILWKHTKTSSEEITFTRLDTLSTV